MTRNFIHTQDIVKPSASRILKTPCLLRHVHWCLLNVMFGSSLQHRNCNTHWLLEGNKQHSISVSCFPVSQHFWLLFQIKWASPDWAYKAFLHGKRTFEHANGLVFSSLQNLAVPIWPFLLKFRAPWEKLYLSYQPCCRFPHTHTLTFSKGWYVVEEKNHVPASCYFPLSPFVLCAYGQGTIVLDLCVWWGMLLSSSLLVKSPQGQSSLLLLQLLYQTLRNRVVSISF